MALGRTVFRHDISPAPPRSPSYRDDRYAVFFFGGVALFASLVAFALAVLTTGPVATVADRLAAPLALAGVGLLVAGTGTGGETVHGRIVSDARGRRLLDALRRRGRGEKSPH